MQTHEDVIDLYGPSFYKTLCGCLLPDPSTSTEFTTSTLTHTTTLARTSNAKGPRSTTTITPSASTITKTTTIANPETTTVTKTSTTTLNIASSAVAIPSDCTSFNETVDSKTYTYTGYHADSCAVERTSNAGNTNGLPVYTSLADDFDTTCEAIKACGLISANQFASRYLSFDMHYLYANQSWECVSYSGKNVLGSAFSVGNDDVVAAYGYSAVAV